MANRIPTKNREIVYERSGGRCELCGRQAKSIHHIIPRRKRIHRPETLIHLGERHHRLAHEILQKHLQVELQNYYKLLGFDIDEIRQKMGGKFYLMENEVFKIVKLHFRRLYRAKINAEEEKDIYPYYID